MYPNKNDIDEICLFYRRFLRTKFSGTNSFLANLIFLEVGIILYIVGTLFDNSNVFGVVVSVVSLSGLRSTSFLSGWGRGSHMCL